MDFNEIVAATEAILFAAGDPVPTGRIAQVLGVPASEVLRAAEFLRNDYEVKGRGIRLLRLEGKLQLCSAPAYSQHVTRALEQRKPPKLSQAAMEVLAVIAYFQPVTRAYMIPPAKPQLFYLLPSSILQKKKKLEKNRVLDGIIREIYIILYSISRNIRKMGRLPP